MAEKKINGTWQPIGEVFPLDEFSRGYYKKDFGSSPFDWRSYGMYGFLADVRNYAHCECITGETRGVPKDASQEYLEKVENWSGDGHSHNWVTLAELVAWDYERPFWNRRITRQTGPNSWNGACLAEEGEGNTETYRDLLGEDFFNDLKALQEQGSPEDVRVVFFFDN